MASKPAPEATPVRDAATVILLRRDPDGPRVLMGQRGAAAAFMPEKFVFPGGAVDPEDGLLPEPALDPLSAARLAVAAPEGLAGRLALAAVRELWEETGLLLGRPGAASGTLPPSWQEFHDKGLVPDTSGLRFVFRAITPPGRSRRFDARFFLADAATVAGNSSAPGGDELAHLQWLTLAEARVLPLPFITEVVLAEVEALVGDPDPGRPVPFFHQGADGPAFRLLRA